jgi:hypothetical protein
VFQLGVFASECLVASRNRTPVYNFSDQGMLVPEMSPEVAFCIRASEGNVALCASDNIST